MKKLILIISAFAIVAVTVIAGITKSAQANPLFFPVTAQTSSATSSPTYMTAGNSTTTLTYDTYTSGNTTGAASAALLLQLVASSTSSILDTNLEYSQDGVDWYQDAGMFNPSFSTTTKPFDISIVNKYRYIWNGTQSGLPAVVLTTGTTTRAIALRTPMRYVRAVFTLPADSAAGAVWAQFVPIKERAE